MLEKTHHFIHTVHGCSTVTSLCLKNSVTAPDSCTTISLAITTTLAYSQRLDFSG